MDTVIFKIDKKLKQKLQKKCKGIGISISDFFRIATKSLVDRDTFAESVIRNMKK